VARFRRLARDDAQWPATLAECHVLAFVILLRKRFVEVMGQSASHALGSPNGMENALGQVMVANRVGDA
jgi:hypothetical protein